MEKKLPLIPYKQIGKFMGTRKPRYYEIDRKAYLAIPTGRSFKVVTLPDLRVKFLGPTFESEVVDIAAFNQILYIAEGSKIESIELDEKISKILLLGTSLIISTLDGVTKILNIEDKSEISRLFADGVVSDIVHPNGYINKILLIGSTELRLFNMISGNNLFDFHTSEKLQKYFMSNQLTCLEMSPIQDFAALGFQDGTVLVVNLKKASVLQKFNQTSGVSALAFSTSVKTDPLLVSTGKDGALLFWSLNEGNLQHRQEKAHSGEITFLQYLEYDEGCLLLSGSSRDNSMKLWYKQEKSDISYTCLRQRQGCVEPLKGIKFYGEDSRHIIGYSQNPHCEIFDFSVLREEMTLELSHSENKAVKRKYLKTETSSDIGSVLSLDFSLNREMHWSNMISANKNGPKPRFWDVSSHKLERLKVETFSKFKASKSDFVKDLGLKKRFITSVAISQCGNFGLSGYNDGYLLKSIMQTGEHSTTFWNKNIHQNKPVIGLFSDSLNHFMITCDDTAIGRWDFFSGRFKDQVVLADGIQSMFGNHNSYLFAVVDRANVIHLFDLNQLKEIREFKGQTSTINDCVILIDDRKLITADANRDIKIWDIFSEQLIFTLKVDQEVSSLSVNNEGTILATVFKGDNFISLWHVTKLTLFEKDPVQVNYVTRLKTRGKDKRAFYFAQKSEGEQDENFQDLSDELFNLVKDHLETKPELKASVKKEDQHLIKFTETPSNRWLPLRDIEQIEQRNKPTQEQQIDVPFFLEFDNPLQRIGQLADGEVMEKEKGYVTKVIREDHKLEFMDSIQDTFVSILSKVEVEDNFSKTNKKHMKQAFTNLQVQTASKINYLLRQSTFEDRENITRILLMFSYLLMQPDNFDVKVLTFNSFIKNVYDRLGEENSLETKLLIRCKESIQKYSKKIGDFYVYLSCLTNKFSA